MHCVERPERIKVHQRPDGQAEVFIRRNIHQVTDADGNIGYECDEAQFVGDYTYAMVEANESELWRKYKPVAIADRILEAERVQAEQDDAITALFEMIGE